MKDEDEVYIELYLKKMRETVFLKNLISKKQTSNRIVISRSKSIWTAREVDRFLLFVQIDTDMLRKCVTMPF